MLYESFLASKISSSMLTDVANKSLKSLLNKYFVNSGTTLNNDDKLAQVADWYKSEQLVFVLGAGVSIAYGLPNWNTLLQKLLLLTLQNDDSSDTDASILAKTFSSVFEPSSLISARYLQHHFQKSHPNANLAFESAIREILYSEITVNEHSPLLKEIRQYCIAAGRTPNLNSIITYNYDDLLEKCLGDIEVDIPFAPIHASGMRNKPNELPIYHVHGYLPEHGQLTYRNKVILSEVGYHQQYLDSYGWSNLSQINKFKDFNCVFIGLSFSDPNLRRILDIAKKERGDDGIHHYCFKEKYDIAKAKQRLNTAIHGIDEGIDSELDVDGLTADLVSLAQKFDENDALSFGIGVIWVDSYDDIPTKLRAIRSLV